MATITFNAGEGFTINNLGGSGLGFYGSGFGTSVPVGEFPSRTFITNSAGTVQGPEVDNCKWASATDVYIGQTGVAKKLTELPNYLATLNIRFSHSSAVSVQNNRLRIYDRSNINNNPTGVTCYVAEIAHTGTSQDDTGLGDSSWVNVKGSSTILALNDSPGLSGAASGSGTIHDWYVALSPSPDSIGSKTFALYFSCEYL